MAAKARGMKVGGFRGVLPTAEHHHMAVQAKKAAAARAADLASLIHDIREAGATSLRGQADAAQTASLDRLRPYLDVPEFGLRSMQTRLLLDR